MLTDAPHQQPPVGAKAQQPVPQHEELQDVAGMAAAVLAAAVHAPALDNRASAGSKGEVPLAGERGDGVLELQQRRGGNKVVN